MDNEEEIDQELKIVMLGNPSVGKTSIIDRLIRKSFGGQNATTLGAMFMTYWVEIDGKSYKLQIWDTAGQERLRTIASIYYRDAQGVFLVYDTTSLSSLEGLESWYRDVVNKGNSGVSLILVGNKADLIESEEVSKEKALEVAQKYEAELRLVSAKEGTGIEELFLTLVKKILVKKPDLCVDRTRASTQLLKKDFESGNKKIGTMKNGCCQS